MQRFQVSLKALTHDRVFSSLTSEGKWASSSQWASHEKNYERDQVSDARTTASFESTEYRLQKVLQRKVQSILQQSSVWLSLGGRASPLTGNQSVRHNSEGVIPMWWARWRWRSIWLRRVSSRRSEKVYNSSPVECCQILRALSKWFTHIPSKCEREDDGLHP